MLAMLFAAAGLARSRNACRHRAAILESDRRQYSYAVVCARGLALPYLPWAADGILRCVCSPGQGRVLVWVIVLGQVAWLWGPAKTDHGPAKPDPTYKRWPFGASVVIAAISLGVYAWSFSRVTRRAANPTGRAHHLLQRCGADLGVGICGPQFEGCGDVRLGSGVFERSGRAQQPTLASCPIR